MNKKYIKPQVEFISVEDVMMEGSGCPTQLCPGTFSADEGDNTYTVNCNWGGNC